MVCRNSKCFMKLPLILTAFLILLKVSAGLNSDVESLIFTFFSAKNLHSIDAVLCSTAERIEMLDYFTGSATADGYYGLFRIIKDFNLEKINGGLRQGILLDFSCPENRQLLQRVTDERWFTNNFCWLIWDPEHLLVNSGVHEQMPISTFSDVNVGDHEGLLRIYRHNWGIPLISSSIGLWRPNSRNLTLKRWDVRIDFQKTLVRGVIMFIDDVFNRSILQDQLVDEGFKPKSDVSNRFVYGNTLHLAYLYNFTLAMDVSPSWGARSENGTWSGMLGMIQRKEADVALSPMLPLTKRLEISYPTISILPYWSAVWSSLSGPGPLLYTADTALKRVPNENFRMAAIVKQPRALGTYRAMILELSPATWACVGLSTVLGAIAFTVTLRRESGLGTTETSIVMGLLQSIGIQASQGLSLVPESNSSRIVSLSMLLVGFLITTYYNAATTTALLSESQPSIKSLDQLIASKTPLAAVDAPYMMNKIRPRVFREVVVDKMEKGVTVYNLTEGIQSILNGSAFFGEFFVLYQGVNDNLDSDTICDLTIFNAGFDHKSVSFMKKCPHFRELFARGLLRTLEHGLMPKERQKWISPRPVCARVTQFIEVRLEAVSVALYLHATGVSLSLIFCIFEIVMARGIREPRRSVLNSPFKN